MTTPAVYHPLFGPDVLSASETAARQGIDNSIPPSLEPNAKRLSAFLGELNAGCLGNWQRGIGLTSGYRCPKLNALVGGANPSDHTLALAADIYCPGITNFELANRFALWCDAYKHDFNQIILEFGRWVHVSLPQTGRKGKREFLTAVKRPNTQGVLKTVYLTGLKATA